MEAILTKTLFKQFGAFTALDDISLEVSKGEIYGFLGLNGAGKTTLIRILLGMIKPSKGEVRIFGKEVNGKFDCWNDIGYLVETPASYPNLTVKENLLVYYNLRQLKDLNAVSSIIKKLKLEQYEHVKAKNLSLGNQQRLGLAKALIHRPKLLILDEPINGLDPQGIMEVRELLVELTQNGSTVFLSSHILGEIAKLASRIGIIHQGGLVREIKHVDLDKELKKKLLVSTNDNKLSQKLLLECGFLVKVNQLNELEIMSDDAIKHPEIISSLLAAKELPVTMLSVYTEELETYFLRTING